MAELQDPLPPGWEKKYDKKQGKYYFINHNNKSTTWDDPRLKRRIPLNPAVEHIPMQHGSPDLRRNYVYPRDTSPIPAFQAPGRYSPKRVPLQEMRGIKSSPLTVRGTRYQDTSLSQAAQETDESVAKISSFFPTVSETHIRILLKKYHNREAVVISALQVEKHPITTPGPFATPPPTRNIQAPLHMQTPPLGLRCGSKGGSVIRTGSATGSPRVGEAYRNSPRPHSSPKLKLRYMKSIFPKAEETVILDILANNDNNIQKASDVLKEMGFEKRDVVKILQQQAESKAEEKRKQEEDEIAKHSPPPPPKILTTDDKEQLKKELKDKYGDTPEQIITLALESVHFDKEKASQVLEIMIQEDSKTNSNEEKNSDVPDGTQEGTFLTVPGVSTSQSKQSIKSLLKRDVSKERCLNRLLEHGDAEVKNNQGPNPSLAKGANDKLLLEDYVKWQGPDPNLRKGPVKGLAKGPNHSLRVARTYIPCGANAELRKGPKFGLAKGSIFAQMKRVVVGDSRSQ